MRHQTQSVWWGPFFRKYGGKVGYGRSFATYAHSAMLCGHIIWIFRTLYLSFGGLLMSLAADKHVVGDLELDMRVYLLVKRSPTSLME